MVKEVNVSFEGGINPERIPDLTTLLGELGVNTEVRIIETEETDEAFEPILGVFDAQLNPNLVTELEDENGNAVTVLDDSKFQAWAKDSDGVMDEQIAINGGQAARHLSRYIYTSTENGGDLAVWTESGPFLRAKEVFNTLSVIDRNPKIVQHAPYVGPKGMEGLRQIAQNLLIPEQSEPDESSE